MREKGIVINPRISPVKKEMAKRLRREMTPEEKILWYYLRNNKLNGLHFRKQQAICGFIADFYCHGAGLVIEVDGGIHELQKDYDNERDLIISLRGLHVLRFRNDEIRNDIYRVIQRILEACKTAKRE